MSSIDNAIFVNFMAVNFMAVKFHCKKMIFCQMT